MYLLSAPSHRRLPAVQSLLRIAFSRVPSPYRVYHRMTFTHHTVFFPGSSLGRRRNPPHHHPTRTQGNGTAVASVLAQALSRAEAGGNSSAAASALAQAAAAGGSEAAAFAQAAASAVASGGCGALDQSLAREWMVLCCPYGCASHGVIVKCDVLMCYARSTVCRIVDVRCTTSPR